MIAYLKIIRPINLCLIAITMSIARYGFISKYEIATSLSNINFLLLILATLFIAAGGYVINDSFDVLIDRINKPNKVIVGNRISQKNASTYYTLLTCIGVGIGFYIANSIAKPVFATYFIVIAALLYSYASFIKKKLLIGNILISLLVGFTLITIILFDILPTLPQANKPTFHFQIINILLKYALFAFYVNFIRELVKDIQDINGDKNGGRHTLPIALGIKRTLQIIFVLSIIAVVSLTLYVYNYLYQYQLVSLYFLIAIIGPLLLFVIKVWSASKNREYAFLSTLLKIILFSGILSLLIYPL